MEFDSAKIENYAHFNTLDNKNLNLSQKIELSPEVPVEEPN